MVPLHPRRGGQCLQVRWLRVRLAILVHSFICFSVRTKHVLFEQWDVFTCFPALPLHSAVAFHETRTTSLKIREEPEYSNQCLVSRYVFFVLHLVSSTSGKSARRRCTGTHQVVKILQPMIQVVSCLVKRGRQLVVPALCCAEPLLPAD